MLWSARELVPLLAFIISLRAVPTEPFLSEAVPIYCLELRISETCLPLLCIVWVLEGDSKCIGYTYYCQSSLIFSGLL